MEKITPGFKSILVFITFLGFTNYIISENIIGLENFLEKFSPKEISLVPRVGTELPVSEDSQTAKTTDEIHEEEKAVSTKPVLTLSSSNVSVCQNSTTATLSYTATNNPATYSINYEDPAITDITDANLFSGSITLVFPQNLSPGTYKAVMAVSNSTNTSDPVNFTLTIHPFPTVNTIENINVCKNSSLATISFSGNIDNATYQWTNNNTAIGLAAGGTGDILSFVATNNSSSVITSQITVTASGNGCTGTPTSFTITVNPEPTVTKPANQTVCNNASVSAINFTGSTVAGTTYKWVNNFPSIGLVESGTGNIPSFTATNSTETPVTAQITVTPVANNCEGTPQVFTITVNPTPVVDGTENIVACNNTSILEIAFGGSSVTGTTYKWTNSNTSIGIPSTGTGNISAFTAKNTSNAPVTSNLTVTPVANNCEGTPKTFTITVNPTPTVTKPGDIIICDKGSVASTVFSGSSISGISYNWVNNTPAIGLAESGTGNIPSFTATNTTTGPVTAQITVTPLANNCEGTPQVFTITVNPTPIVDDTENIVACNNTSIPEIAFVGSSVTGTTYKWTNSNTSIGIPSTGTGNISAFTAINTSNAPVTSNLTVTPVANNCEGTPKTFTITVNPTPAVTKPADIVVCDKATISNINFTGSSVSGTTYKWENDNPTIGLAASGTGNILSFTGTNITSVPQTARITVIPVANNCEGSPQIFTIVVNPTANVIKPNNIVACKGEAVSGVTFSGSNVDGTTYKWTNDNSQIGLAAYGNGNIPSFTATNTTNSPITANLRVTPVANGCEGTSEIFTITVNPETTVNAQDNIYACNQESLSETVFTGSSVNGTVYNWTNDNPSIGLPANGTGNLPPFVALNNTGEVLVATISLTPQANGCEGNSTTFEIIVFPSIYINAPEITVTPVGCKGEKDGVISIGQVHGGNGTYLFSLDAQNFGSVKTFTGLAEGYYTIYIKDTKRCSFEKEIYVGEPDELSMLQPEFTTPSCFGASDGTITAGVVTGGNGGYLFSLDNENFSTQNTFTGVSAGNHTIFVNDSRGCSLQTLITVNGPAILNASVAGVNLSCFGGNDGSILISNPTGGHGTFEYSINGTTWQSNGTFSNLTAGTYAVSMRDAANPGCVVVLNSAYIINQPAAPVAVTNISTTRTTTFGTASGSATVDFSGGTPGYTYEWRRKGGNTILQTTKTATNLLAGIYEITVKDRNGCALKQEVTIIDKVRASIISASECLSVHDMIRTSFFRVDMDSIAGGVGSKENFVYEWNFGTGASPATATGKGEFEVSYSTSGDKDVTLKVTDEANVTSQYIFPHYVGGCFEGCGTTSNFQIDNNNVFIGDKNGIPLTGENCEQTTEKFLWIDIKQSANGYSLSAELNYSVNDGETTTARRAIGCFAELISGTPGGNGQNTPRYALIPLGLFRLFPVDASGNDATKVIWKCGETFNVEQINIRWTNQETRGCNEGTKPMCYGPTDEVDVLTPVLATAVPQPVLCKGDSTGSIAITATGGTRPYQYSINGDKNYKTTNEFFNLPAGTYSEIWVKDSRGTKFKVSSVTIEEPAQGLSASVTNTPIACFDETASATVTPSGGTPFEDGTYNYLWNDPLEQTTVTASGLSAGNYTVTVIDANGCQILKEVSIAQPEQLSIAVTGDNQSFSCGFNSTTLEANAPVTGVGSWSIISGTGGVIAEVSNPKSKFTGGSDTYTLRWTIAHPDGTCSTYSDVLVSFTNDCSTLDFDGVDDHIVFGDNYGLSTGAFTLEAWVKLHSLSGVKTILSKRNASNLGQGGYDLIINNGAPTFRSGTTVISTSSKLGTNRWYHIAVIFNNSKAEIYVDGLNVGNGAANNPLSLESPFIIGAMNDNATPTVPKHYFHGWIEEVRLWNATLTLEQMRFMMNQRIEPMGTAVKGTVLPMNVPSNLSWNNLLGYYRLKVNEIENGWTKDGANTKVDGNLKNILTLQENTAPLPYISAANGTWRDKNNWAQPVVWDAPNSLGINGESIDWNIASISHDLKSGGKDLTLLGLLSEAGKLEMANPNETLDENNSGQGLFITHYLKLNGFIDLVGESQLVQTDISPKQTIPSTLDEASTGYIERDQQGTANSYNYNYWSSPVSLQGAANNSTYTIKEVKKDGTNSASATHPDLSFGAWHEFADGPFGSPRKISNFWLFKFRGTANVYSEWAHIGHSGILSAGEGYTMKGTSGTAAITDRQNYVYKGKPNNGLINLTIATEQNYLLGNPYPSSIDVNEFIMDNLKDVAGGRNTKNIFNGTVYFWDHFAGGNTHILLEYIGGYAARNLLGGVPAISNDIRINANDAKGSKIPGRFIPVAQGFFINSTHEDESPGSVTVDGGEVVFRNGQRAFVRESKTNTGNSVFLRPEQPKQKSIEDTRAQIRLDFKSPKKYNRQILVGVDPNTTSGFDLGYDAALNDNNVEDMYWMINNREYIIQGVPDFNPERILPLGIKIAQEGEFSIKINNLENVDDDVNIYLKDNETNSYFNLRKSDYKLNIGAGTYHERFELVFQIKTETEEPESDEDEDENQEEEEEEEEEEEVVVVVPGDDLDKPEELVKINPEIFFLTNSGELIVKNPDLQVITQITLHGMSGQVIEIYENIPTQKETRLPVRNYSSSVYLVKMFTENGIIHKKLIFNY